MDCNKVEAIRAKNIAEKKLKGRDFVQARKFALKAQQLFPDLDNISQMLTICDIHYFSQSKNFESEMDFYGILQVEATADLASIKKQYRKLAFQLHPDRNKFEGAEAAFKVIGEAQRTLCDLTKRTLYDMKRTTLIRTGVPRQPTQPPDGPNINPYVKSQPGILNHFTDSNKSQFFGLHRPSPPTQTQTLFHSRSAFSTLCPHCGAKYQYYRNAMNKPIICPNCVSSFIASEKGEGRPAGNSSLKRKRKMTVESSDSDDTDSEYIITEELMLADKQNDRASSSRHPRRSSRHKQEVSYKEDTSDDDDFVNPSGVKRARRALSSDHSSRTDGGHLEEDAWKDDGPPPVPSIIDNENLRNAKEQMRNRKSDGKEENEANCTVDLTLGSNTIPDNLEYYPDAEFNDFEKVREANKFAVDQIWAIYDACDGMPRFYARIRKVYSPEFKLQINWLDADPISNDEIIWLKNELPIACGNFKHAGCEETENRLMFSHLMSPSKGRRGYSYDLYPRKGETWALFKDWNINWSSDPDKLRKYDYEIVEVLSDYSSKEGVTVCHLVKVEGFICLFQRSTSEGATFHIPATEVLRFSHCIPSFRLTGKERNDAPVESLELDPASLPPYIDTISSLKSYNDAAAQGDNKKDNEKHKPADVNLSDEWINRESAGLNGGSSIKIDVTSVPECQACEETRAPDTDVHSPVSSPQLVSISCPDPQFHNFDVERSRGEFQPGQVWALYSDIDGYPKFYAQVKKVELESFKVQISWLEECPASETEYLWHGNHLPAGCGFFYVPGGVDETYDSTEMFSHQMQVAQARKSRYTFYPSKHEIWAVFKDWSPSWKESNLHNCELDVVEVLTDDAPFELSVLEKVNGYMSVFREGSSAVTMKITKNEILKFSHRIPSFKLTEERGGKLRGCLELDPASVPQKLLFVDSDSH
ncbi:hypothetical protein QJS04_geneDACA021124 [Acorus gramineus]|uniref:J domain-containing protein n=1 Tax=Acorus gramineus TaxID=55184 RepID=A0AAV9BKE7_ACOGR|nr:hypothetical protein QJS04_geneDACA021124 [Acorus gramineus]